MTFNGIPLHPLVVHAAVVFTPLAALAVLAFALVPRWRRAVRWPAALVALVAAGSVQLAAITGDNLKEKLGVHSSVLEQHETWAGRLQVGMWVLAGVMVVACWALPVRSADGERAERAAAVRLPVSVLLVAGAVAVGYLVYRTGDAGAQAVWAGSK